MNRKQLVKRVRNITRDLMNSTFRETDIHEFLDEAVDRVKQVIPEFRDMRYLTGDEIEPAFIPSHYHHLLATYASASLYFQDDRHHQATVKMNEFETKLGELLADFHGGQVEVKDPDGVNVYPNMHHDYVRNNYFLTRTGGVDIDPGVEGVGY